MANLTPPKIQMARNLDAMKRATIANAKKRLIATAADARKEIQRSLKSGGKNRYSKTYQTSKPGEPPKTHGARLKRSIRYEVDDKKIKVGAPSISGSRTAKTLEEGGAGKLTETKTTSAYFARRKARAAAAKRKTRAAQKTGAPLPPQKPQTQRAYTMRSDADQTRRVTQYERFESRAAYERAQGSAAFRSWRDTIQKTTTVRLQVAPRPFVKPGAVKAAEKTR